MATNTSGAPRTATATIIRRLASCAWLGAACLTLFLTACSSGNPLLGKWKPAGTNDGMVRLGSLEFTPTEELVYGSDGKLGSRFPVTYQVHGSMIDISGGMISQCEVHGDEMRANLPLVGATPYVRNGSFSTADAGDTAPTPPGPPTLPPGPDPAIVFLNAVSKDDEPTLIAASANVQGQLAAEYQGNPQSLWPKVKQDVLDQAHAQFTKFPLGFGVDANLFCHNASFKVTDTKIGDRNEDGSVSATKYVEFDYSSPDDSPLTEKGYLRKAVIALNVVVTPHPKDGWPVNFCLNGAPSLVDAGSEYWPDVPPHFLSIGSSLTPDNLGSFFLTTIGGTAPFRLTIVCDGHRTAEYEFDSLPLRLQVTNVPLNGSSQVTLRLTDAKNRGDAVSLDLGMNNTWVSARLFDHDIWKSTFMGNGSYGASAPKVSPLTPVSPDDVQRIVDADAAARVAQAATIHRIVQDGIFFYEAEAMPGIWSEPIAVPQNPTGGNIRVADPDHIRITVDNVPYTKPSPIPFKGSSVIRFMSTSDQPNPFAVRMFVRKMTDEEKKLPPYVMPPWPPETPSGAGYSDQATHDALIDVLKKGPTFHGTASQNRQRPTPVEVSLTFDNTTQLATGWLYLPAYKVKKRLSGRIVDDGTGKTVLLLIETETATSPSPDEIVGTSYWFTPGAPGSAPQLTGTFTYPTGPGVYPSEFVGTSTLTPGPAPDSATSNP